MLHVKVCILKGLVYFYTHFESIKRDAWPNDSLYVSTPCAIGCVHCLYRFCNDTSYGASPSCVYGGYGVMCAVIEE